LYDKNYHSFSFQLENFKNAGMNEASILNLIANNLLVIKNFRIMQKYMREEDIGSNLSLTPGRMFYMKKNPLSLIDIDVLLETIINIERNVRKGIIKYTNILKHLMFVRSKF
jgi:hypothetical protein